jgi:glycosyltransferase involved in cell wall biosynthesis
MSDKKIKILTLSDHPKSPSGVGTQTNYILENMVKTGKYKVMSLGGALKHPDMRPMKFHEYGDDYIILPVENGYGTPELLRSLIMKEKPDILWYMTDPRFYLWLWSFEQEIRANVPMVYYHVWDNYPYPKFNRPYYLSNEKVVTISKLTSDIVRTVAPEVEEEYLPHAVDDSIYKPLDISEYKHLLNPNKTLFFWTNRNAKRKLSGTVMWWYKEFLDAVGQDKALLIMHTDPKDPHGQDLIAIAEELGLTRDNFAISPGKIPPAEMAKFYNAADCTINISDAEGFGLSILESLSCGTPVIANKTGGMQDQVTDGKEQFGFLLEPSSRVIVGSQEVPWIYEDRVSNKDVVEAMIKIHKMSREQRKKLGEAGRQHVLKNFNFNNFISSWDRIFTNVYEKHGSWETRKNYKSWDLKEI